MRSVRLVKESLLLLKRYPYDNPHYAANGLNHSRSQSSYGPVSSQKSDWVHLGLFSLECIQ